MEEINNASLCTIALIMGIVIVLCSVGFFLWHEDTSQSMLEECMEECYQSDPERTHLCNLECIKTFDDDCGRLEGRG